MDLGNREAKGFRREDHVPRLRRSYIWPTLEDEWLWDAENLGGAEFVQSWRSVEELDQLLIGYRVEQSAIERKVDVIFDRIRLAETRWY